MYVLKLCHAFRYKDIPDVLPKFFRWSWNWFFPFPKWTFTVVAPPVSILSELLCRFSVFSFQSSTFAFLFMSHIFYTSYHTHCFPLDCVHLLLPAEMRQRTPAGTSPLLQNNCYCCLCKESFIVRKKLVSSSAVSDYWHTPSLSSVMWIIKHQNCKGIKRDYLVNDTQKSLKYVCLACSLKMSNIGDFMIIIDNLLQCFILFTFRGRRQKCYLKSHCRVQSEKSPSSDVMLPG